MLYFSLPVDSFQIVSPDGTLLEAACYGASCMDRFTGAACCESTVWEEADAGDYGYPEVGCSISASIRTQSDTQSCTNRFTITAETTDGKYGTVTFVNYYSYDDPDRRL